MKAIEKVFLYVSTIPIVSILLIISIEILINPSHGSRMDGVIFYYFIGIVSGVIGVWGIKLVHRARERKPAFWKLIVATFIASIPFIILLQVIVGTILF